MSIMCHTSTLLLVLLYKLSMLNQTDSCGHIILQNAEGIINIKGKNFNSSVFCQWFIWPPPNSITTIRMIGSDTPVLDDSCLSILINPRIDFCNKNIKSYQTFSVRERVIPVILKSKPPLNFHLEFSTRKEEECRHHEFQCLDKSNCYNLSKIRKDKFMCEDHSDKLGFPPCSFNTTLCNVESGTCFTPSQRCDNTLDCPKGDDELNCSEHCPGKIKCLGRGKQICVTQSQICDDVLDCPNGEDESNCGSVHSKTMIVIILFVVFCLCTIIFMCLIFRWISTRRNVNRLLDNLPQFPLAPFQAPGENDIDSIASSDMAESDFRHGGEIYESFMQMHHIKKRTASKSIQVGMAKYSHLDLDGDNEIVVLASLNIPHDKCLGLNLSEESVLSLKSRGSPNNSSRESDSKTTADLLKLALSLEETKSFSSITNDPDELKRISRIRTAVFDEQTSKKYIKCKSAKVCFNNFSETEIVRLSKSDTGIFKDDKEHLGYQDELELLRNSFLGIFSDASNQWIDIEDEVDRERERGRPVTSRIVKVKSAKECTRRNARKKVTYSVKSLG